MTEVDADGNTIVKVRKSNTGMFTQLVSDARAAEWELVQPGDEDRLFYRMSWWRKVVVMAGGPTVNILIAFFLFWGIFATVGNARDLSFQPVVAETVPCIVPFEESGRECTAEDPLSPAAEAGLEPGDRFVEFNGTAVTSWEQMQELIRNNDDGEAVIVVDRDGERVTVTTNTTVQARPTGDDAETLTQVGFLGVSPTYTVATGGPIYTLDEMGYMTKESIQALATLPVKVGHVALAIVGLEQRDPEGPISIVGGGRLAGETAAHTEINVQDKVVGLIGLIAAFNLFIGIFNFVPLLPLDGGHIAGALWEAVRRGVARVTGRPDPGYVDVAKLLPVAYVVGACLLVMGLVLIVGDLVVPVQFG